MPQADGTGGRRVELLLGQVHVAFDLDALHELRELVSDGRLSFSSAAWCVSR